MSVSDKLAALYVGGSYAPENIAAINTRAREFLDDAEDRCVYVSKTRLAEIIMTHLEASGAYMNGDTESSYFDGWISPDEIAESIATATERLTLPCCYSYRQRWQIGEEPK